jgi:hypothetical protein
MWSSYNMDKPIYLLEVSPLVVINMACANLIDKGHTTLLMHLSSLHILYICNQLAPLKVQGKLFLQLANDMGHHSMDCPCILVHPFLPIENVIWQNILHSKNGVQL